MPQDRESGDRARRYGYQMAERVAEALGATLINPGVSNEATWRNQRILIKSARYRTSEIGATEATLQRVDAIVAALQDSNDGYTLYQVTPVWFRERMRPSRSSGDGHVMKVQCRSVREAGTVVGHIRVDL